jgi:hypothetical protein
MRKFLVALMLALSLLAVPAAQADTPGCVSRQEYYRISVGMKMARVHAIFDTSGRLMWRKHHAQRRAYRICNVGEGVYVRYVRHHHVWRVSSKTAKAQ